MNYQLVSAENENYTRQIAAKADEMIRRVMQNNPQLSLNMSTILALVNALDEMSRIYQQFSSADGQRLDTEKQAGETRKELMRLREQNWEMKKEILRLNKLCQDYEAILASVPPTPMTAFGKDPDCDTAGTVGGCDLEAAGEEPDATEVAEVSVATSNNLTQTNLEDYLRENGWPPPIGKDSYDR